jgi:hypothetical protein
MAQDPFSDMMSAWKKVNDDFLATWGKTFERFTTSTEGEAVSQEATKTYLGMRTAMADAAKNAYGPIIEAVGAVPLSEFQRLADQVHTILLRMDRIDDALRTLVAANRPGATATARPAIALDASAERKAPPAAKRARPSSARGKKSPGRVKTPKA